MTFKQTIKEYDNRLEEVISQLTMSKVLRMGLWTYFAPHKIAYFVVLIAQAYSSMEDEK